VQLGLTAHGRSLPRDNMLEPTFAAMTLRQRVHGQRRCICALTVSRLAHGHSFLSKRSVRRQDHKNKRTCVHVGTCCIKVSCCDMVAERTALNDLCYKSRNSCEHCRVFRHVKHESRSFSLGYGIPLAYQTEWCFVVSLRLLRVTSSG
jgi:hypothetical protein